jgi:ABC-type multidrug transport system fused ATPase/permease subunit
VICDAPILILDEVATGLDAASQKLVLDALGRLMEGRTSIVISHSLASVRSAGIIFVLKSGQIVEQGKHDELLKNGGMYAEFYQAQSR